MSGPLPQGPLPIVTPVAPARLLIGSWRATVTNVGNGDPLSVDVPELTGQGSVNRVVEAVAGIGTLVRGDRVWVTCINGRAEALLVTARRV